MILRSLAVFVAAIVADACWARWAIHSAARHPAAAATWGVGIVLCGAVAVQAYTDSSWYLIPTALGAWAGTFLAVWSR